MNAQVATPLSSHVHRLQTEYLEMPGLRLTCVQAQRLCGLDAITCAEALQMLVESGFLRRTDTGQYVRLTEGPLSGPGFRMAKAQLKVPETSLRARPGQLRRPPSLR